MTTAERLRAISAKAENDKYWTTEAYVRNIERHMERCARMNLTRMYWVPSVDLGEGNLVPNRERMYLIIKQLRDKGIRANLARNEKVLEIRWDEYSLGNWCIVM